MQHNKSIVQGSFIYFSIVSRQVRLDIFRPKKFYRHGPSGWKYKIYFASVWDIVLCYSYSCIACGEHRAAVNSEAAAIGTLFRWTLHYTTDVVLGLSS